MYKIVKSLYNAIEKTIYDDGVEHAGYMAFMLILSLFPFLVFFLALTSFIGASEIGENLIEILIDTSPEKAVDSIRSRLEEIKKAPPTSLINLAIFGTIWTASSFVEALRTILNKIFEVYSPPHYIFRRILSIVQFLVLCAIITAIMYLFIFLPAIFHKYQIPEIIGKSNYLHFSKYFYLFLTIFICVLSFYRFIPNAKLKTIYLVPGALLTTSTCIASGYLLTKYIKYYYQLSIVYGSLGSIIITMLFFFVISFLFIVGAAFSHELFKEKLSKKSH